MTRDQANSIVRDALTIAVNAVPPEVRADALEFALKSLSDSVKRELLRVMTSVEWDFFLAWIRG